MEIPDSEWQEILSIRTKQQAKRERLTQEAMLPLFVPSTNPVDHKLQHKVEIFFDGGCHGNPGQKYGSYETKLDGRKVGGKTRVDFGFGTSCEAEWDSLILALKRLEAGLTYLKITPAQCELLIYTDSTIVRNRLMGQNKILKKYPRSAVMFELANQCLEVMRQFGHCDVTWKGRESNVQRFGH